MRARTWGLISIGLLLVVACGGRTPTRADEPMAEGEGGVDDPGPAELRESDKLDILFVVDNTRTGSFAHPALIRTVPYLLDRLLSPPCVNGLGQIVDTPDASGACERGLRDFTPLRDIHMGVISTSLGGHGSDSCSMAAEENDQGRLLTRIAGGGTVPSYAGLGFLAWDPDQRANPPGDSDSIAYENKLVEIMTGVGTEGCGFEAPLEAVYRFLIEPEPYAQINVVDGVATPTGIDQVLLDQRAAFLRPDSAVLVVIVSDEDDCSIRDGSTNYFVAQNSGGTFRMPPARSICATAPDDPCCTSCAAAPPQGCAPDVACNQGSLSEAEDPINLRCFDQKRRFGVDFLYPIDRYVTGLTERSVTNTRGEVVDNPLFTGRRSASMVTIAAITGVPWQDIAVSSMSPAAGYLPPNEIPWSRVLAGDDTPPDDPLMITSREPRSGTHPVTGDALAPPESPTADANPINGHEHALATELQFSCIYEVEQPVACTDMRCNCAPGNLNPVCQQVDGTYADIQRFGRATPATRQLELIRALDTTSALASICTTPVFDDAAPGFAYKPAVDAMLRTTRRSLVKP